MSETEGDGSALECPWCGEEMNMHDDNRIEPAIGREALDRCEHCDQGFLLSAHIEVTTVARRP